MLSHHFMKSMQKRLTPVFAAAVLGGSAIWCGADQPTRFETVFHLIRTNLHGIDSERFEKEALRGLLRRMEGRAELIKAGEPEVTLATELAEPTKVFEKRYGYLRVHQVEAGLAETIQQGIQGKSDLHGLMVDLRFAQGRDYGAAVRAANQFVNRDETQLVIGERHLRTGLNENAISGPVAILVNAKTTGAAEALAALLRRNEVGLLIGSRTAGATKVFSVFPLEDGSQLRVATDEVRAGDGEPLSAAGLTPDITVEIDLMRERGYLSDAFALPKGRKKPSGRINEAALVRQLKLKLNPQAEVPGLPAGGEEEREVFDPVLGRALDLLKGLDVLKSGE